MIIPTNGPDKAQGLCIQKLHKVNGVSNVDRVAPKDVVSISKFSSLVEQARAAAMSLPDVRSDAVERARQALHEGKRPQCSDIASAMINRAAKGEA